MKTELEELIHELRVKRRDKIFLLVYSKGVDEVEIYCHQNGIDLLDYREEILKEIRPGQEKEIIKDEAELERLKQICKNHSGKVLVLKNFDLILGYFNFDDRKYFWMQLHSHLPHLEAVVGLPIRSGSGLLPGNIDEWRQEHRVLEI